MTYVVDTHTLAWYFTKDQRLGNKSKTILQKAEQGEHHILLPVIVLLEALDIQEKKKIDFGIGKLFDFIEQNANFTVVNLDLKQVREVTKTGKGLDLHDRIIATVAETNGAIILTKDREIKKLFKTVW